MNVLIASSDAVFARMLELEFLERGISCVTAGTQDEADAVSGREARRYRCKAALIRGIPAAVSV